MDNLVGQTLNRYQILSLLGEGGMGAVYKGHDMTLQRDVAIKVMHAHFAANKDFQGRFLQEARTAARMDHPGIVQVYDFGQDRSALYIVMKFIPGDNLEKMLRDLRAQDKWITLNESVLLIQQVARALDYAHRQGVLHRDIKPGNVMIEPEPTEGLPYRAILTDLGLAKLAEGGIVTQDGTSMGTPAYMSPEQALGNTTDARSDVYSLGILLFELATGRLPFPARSLADAIQFHVQTPPPAPRSIRPDLPEGLEQIILKTLEKEPAKRYQSAAALATALKAISKTTVTLRSAPSPLQATVSLFTQYQQSLVEQRGQSVLEEFEQPSEVPQDRIQVLDQDKTNRSFLIKRPSMSIGRDDDNDIALDDHKVSRHHTRIEFDGQGYRIVDLNSTNGTYLANQRLLPGVAEPWLPEKALRIGDTWFRLLLADQHSQVNPRLTVRQPLEMMAGILPPTASPAGKPVSLYLDATQVSVEPGQSLNLPVVILNQSASADNFTLSVTGVPAPWVTVPTRPVSLAPGEQKQVSITLHPPRDAHSRLGRYPLSVSVASQSHPGQYSETALELSVTAFSLFTSDLFPSRLRLGQTGRVSIHNQGNAPTIFSLSWRDPSNQLVFTPPKAQFTVPEGQEIVAEFRIESRQNPLIGGEKSYSYSAQINPAGGVSAGPPPQTHNAEAVGRGLVPTWAIPVFLILCVALAVVGGLLSSVLFPGAGAATSTSQTSLTEVGLVVQQTNSAATATALLLEGANQATRNAATAAQLAINQTESANQATSQIAAAQTDTAKQATDQQSLRQTQDAATAFAKQATDQMAMVLTSGAQQATQQMAIKMTAEAKQATNQMAYLMTAAAAQTAGAAQSATLTAMAQVRIAYIFSSDSGAANDFRTFLQSQGFTVDLIPQGSIGATDLSHYRAFLIGHETGNAYDWGDSGGSQANQIASTGKPIMGIGEGGSSFFSKLGLSIGWGAGWVGSGTDVTVVNPSYPYWNSPHNVAIPASHTISLYNNSTGFVAIYQPSPPMGIETIALQAGDANHYMLIMQTSQFFLWGFEGAPSAMTGKGQRVFINILSSLIH
jgi:serine/threonine protein kinase